METIKNIWFADGKIFMAADSGAVYHRPLEAFPRLKDASPEARERYVITLHGTALRWNELDEDIHISSFYETNLPNSDNEVATIFDRFPQLNPSEVARSIGIDKSLLEKYVYGMQTPSRERLEQIKQALHRLGKELIAV